MDLRIRSPSFIKLTARLFRKPVTVRGSFGVIASESRLLPRRDQDRCTGCGACNERCSSGATSITDTGTTRTILIEGLRCIFCARCADVCPEGALDLRFGPVFSDEERNSDKGEIRSASSEWLCLTDSDLNLQVSDKYAPVISLSHESKEKGPTVETHLQLQTCPICGEVMPVTGKFLEVLSHRTIEHLQPDTAAVMKIDMEKYMTACISCRRKMSVHWNTHPRKFI